MTDTAGAHPSPCPSLCTRLPLLAYTCDPLWSSTTLEDGSLRPLLQPPALPPRLFHLDPMRLDAFLVQLSLPAGSRCPAWPQALPKGRTHSTDHMVLSPCQLLLRESPEERHLQQVARSAPVPTQLQNGHTPLGALPGFTELRPAWHLGECVAHRRSSGKSALITSATGYKGTAVIHSNFQTPDYYSGFTSDASRAQCLLPLVTGKSGRSVSVS